jgi:hypothetical protein
MTLNVPLLRSFRNNDLCRNLIHAGLSIGFELCRPRCSLLRGFSGETLLDPTAITSIGETRTALILR